MKKYYLVFFIFVLTACVKQPDGHRHPQTRHPGPPSSLFDFFFSDTGKRSPNKSPGAYTVRGRTYKTMKSSAGYREKGTATWYGKHFHNQRTSSGEQYNMYAMTAAHRTLPLNAYVKVTNLKNGRSVVVRINDRGPFHSNRLIDLSYAAARGIGLLPAGVAQVALEASSPQKIQRPVHKRVIKKRQQRHTRHTAPMRRHAKQVHKPILKKRTIHHAKPVKHRRAQHA